MTHRDRDDVSRVVITGASSGIGQATAELFARRGATLILAARNRAALEEVAVRCKAAGGEAIAVETDVTDIGSVRALADTPMEAHERVIRTNLVGHMNDAHAAVPIF